MEMKRYDNFKDWVDGKKLPTHHRRWLLDNLALHGDTHKSSFFKVGKQGDHTRLEVWVISPKNIVSGGYDYPEAETFEKPMVTLVFNSNYAFKL